MDATSLTLKNQPENTMNAITAAATTAKATIDRLLSNGKASAKSGLVKFDHRLEWTYSEPFSGPEISVNYRREGKEWIYTVMNDNADSAFFNKTGAARTLREARLEALDAMVAGRTAQAEKAENGDKEELLRLLKNGDQSAAIQAVLLSDLLPDDLLQRWLDGLIERTIRRVIGLPACPRWTGRAAWEAWAVKRLHSKDRDSKALLKATEKVIAATVKEAKWAERSEVLHADAPIWAAVEAAKASHREQCGPFRHYALLASWSAVKTAKEAALARCGSSPGVTEAGQAEQEAQHRDLLGLINEM
jgi:hypothetical protein